MNNQNDDLAMEMLTQKAAETCFDSLERLHRDMGALLLLRKTEQFGPEAGKGDDFMRGGILMLKQLKDYLDKVKENTSK